MSATAIKLPVVQDGGVVREPNGGWVCGGAHVTVAAEIVSALNGRPALLADVERMRELLRKALAFMPTDDPARAFNRETLWGEDVRNEIRAALASKED